MKPLIILLAVFTISILVKALLKSQSFSLQFNGKLAFSSMLIFTGIAHFIFEEGMMRMLPDFIPFKIAIIYVTGILEILAAVVLLFPLYSRITGQLLIAFLICVLPANIFAAMHHIDPVSGSMEGPGLEYLFFRIPLQLFFISWIYFFAIRNGNIKHPSKNSAKNSLAKNENKSN